MNIEEFALSKFIEGKITIIFLTGKAGSGKTTLANKLSNIYEKNKIYSDVLNQDSFFKLSRTERKEWLEEGFKIGKEEYEKRSNPFLWYDFKSMENVLRKLKSGQKIHMKKIYNRKDEGNLTGEINININILKGGVIIFEGVILPHLKEFSDCILYIDENFETRKNRLIERDIHRKGSLALKRIQLVESFADNYFLKNMKNIDLVYKNNIVLKTQNISMNELKILTGKKDSTYITIVNFKLKNISLDKKNHLMILKKIVESHEAFSYNYIKIDNFWKRIKIKYEIPINFLNIENENDIENCIIKERDLLSNNDLFSGPLFKILSYPENNLVLIAHHIIFDLYSIKILLEELNFLYEQYNKKEVLNINKEQITYDNYRDFMENKYIMRKNRNEWISILKNNNFFHLNTVNKKTYKNKDIFHYNFPKKMLLKDKKIKHLPTIILTLLLLSWNKTTGQKDGLLSITSRGRNIPLDLSKTVGCFASSKTFGYFSTDNEKSLDYNIKKISEYLYDVSLCECDWTILLKDPEILKILENKHGYLNFNYLKTLDYEHISSLGNLKIVEDDYIKYKNNDTSLIKNSVKLWVVENKDLIDIFIIYNTHIHDLSIIESLFKDIKNRIINFLL